MINNGKRNETEQNNNENFHSFEITGKQENEKKTKDKHYNNNRYIIRYTYTFWCYFSPRKILNILPIIIINYIFQLI